MKSSKHFLILYILVVFISGCQSQSSVASSSTEVPTSFTQPTITQVPTTVMPETTTPISPQRQLFVSPESCASTNGQLPTLYNSETPPLRKVSSTLGGGVVQSNEFTFELFLYCDPIFQPDAIQTYHYSDIGGLAIYSNWRYDARYKSGVFNGFFGFEPDIRWQTGGGPYLSQGHIAQGYSTGMNITLSIHPDLSKPTSFRFIHIMQTESGQFSGAVLSFDIQQLSDGIHPSNIHVTTLSDVELVSMEYLKNLIPTETP